MSDIPRIAVIGAGNWGRNLVRNFYELLGQSRLLVYDTNGEVLQRVVRTFPGIVPLSDLEELWGDPGIQAVVIATPASTHAEIAQQALLAAKHVFVEKPLALHADDAERLCCLADEQGRVLMVDHLLLFHPAVDELIRQARAGELGRINYLYSQRVNLGVVRAEESALWSLGPHDIAVALAILDADPVHVSAQGGAYLQEENGIQDVVFLTLTFPAGVLVHLHLSWLDPHKIRKLTVIGSEKMIVFDDMEPQEKLRIYNKVITIAAPNAGPQVSYGDIRTLTVPLSEPLRLACQHFLSCVARAERPISDGWTGLRVVRVLEAAQQSIALAGKPVPFSQGMNSL